MYYNELKIDIDPFKNLPDHYFIPAPFDKESPIWNKYIDSNDINKETHEWFRENGLEVAHSMLFAHSGKTKTYAHVDGYQTAEKDSRVYSAINFSKGGVGVLSWYEIINPENAHPGITPLSTTPYQIYDYNDVKLIKRYLYKDNQPVLVDVNTPHSAENLNNNMRYTISLRWEPILSFNDALEKFKNYI